MMCPKGKTPKAMLLYPSYQIRRIRFHPQPIHNARAFPSSHRVHATVKTGQIDGHHEERTEGQRTQICAHVIGHTDRYRARLQ